MLKKMSSPVSQARILIPMACRRVSEGSQGPAYSSGRRLPLPPLRKILGKIPFLVVGGVATGMYMPERMTLDTDILVDAQDEHRVTKSLQSAGGVQKGALAIGGHTWGLPGDWVLDVLVLDRPWIQQALKRPVQDPASGLPMIALPYLVLMKLESSRTQDLADISRMLGCADDASLKKCRRILSTFRPWDLEDLDSLIKLGRMEQGRNPTKT